MEWHGRDSRGHGGHAIWFERVERHLRREEETAGYFGIAAAGCRNRHGYDRSGLIRDSIATLQRDLIEEAIIVSLVIIVFLFHFRSAFIPILTLPIAVIGVFLPMYYLQVSSNIMSLGGIALAIGVLVDAAIVMVENGYRHFLKPQNRKTGGAP